MEVVCTYQQLDDHSYFDVVEPMSLFDLSGLVASRRTSNLSIRTTSVRDHNKPGRDSNCNFPIIGSRVYYKSDTLNHANTDVGPKHWAESYQTCSGKYQSPIDIEEHLVSQVRLPPLNFQGFKSKSVSSTLTNNGHTGLWAIGCLRLVQGVILTIDWNASDGGDQVVLQLNTSDEAILSGGPLKGNYIFAQLHFHWGANDSIGSEDTINNHTFPLELHLVFFKQDYVSFNHALDFKDGLTVLAVFFEVYGDDNDIYSEIVSHLPRVVNPGTNARLKRPVNLDSLLPSIRHLYFTYEGSLTTPPCSEVVTWIDFKQPILLSARQVNAFRKLRSEEGTLTQNFRPVQPLSGRLIHFNVADDLSRSGESSMLRSVPVGALCITVAVLTLQAIYSR
ncbi:unnamed protein product [Timema podura]|uniref:Alpha-carbonic anhydrase domain-containing protein n=1 Tax=Timema podura TaxID=61482 RepID=A0ABN7NKG2_TIMPD|nr:unnamed protein product [Timema podura]